MRCHSITEASIGGDIDFIEFLDGHARGHARARCVVTSEIERRVACGGFAAEFYLLSNDYAERGRDDERVISQIVFHNATSEREDFWGRRLGSDEVFTEAEDREFMNHAIGSDGHGGVVPIFNQYFSRMQEIVREFAKRGESKGGE